MLSAIKLVNLLDLGVSNGNMVFIPTATDSWSDNRLDATLTHLSRCRELGKLANQERAGPLTVFRMS